MLFWYERIGNKCRAFNLLKNAPTPASFFFFQANFTILTTNKCKNCPSSIWRRDSNSQPSGYKSPPLTTRPWLQPESQPNTSNSIKRIQAILKVCMVHRDQYYKTIFAVIELPSNYSKILMHCVRCSVSF